MSRLIVKNLPKNITEDKLRSIFGQKGVITDIQLKYTKDGIFRQFGFVGYQNEEQAENAIKYFNNSCIQTNRIKVETCAQLGATEKPKAWSKYSKESTAFKKSHGIVENNEENVKPKEFKKKVIDEIIGEHKNDPKFAEFIEVHSKNRTLWENDATATTDKIEDNQNKVVSQNKEKQIIKPNDNDDENEDSGNESDTSGKKLAEKEISDLEYMKSLMKKQDNNKTKTTLEKQSKQIDLFTIKIHNLPYKLKRSDIIKFFKPIKPYSIRLPTSVHGFCYVGFKTEKDFKKAMLKDKSFIKKKQVFFSDFTEKNKITKQKRQQDDDSQEDNSWKNPKWLKQEESVKNEEDISESGKIFFRNLSYTVTEDDLQNVFEKYGPIAEINLPIDPITRQIKGFGTVTFVMPEHAVTAFNELDGSMFQGRLLHLIPGKSENKNENEFDENSSNYKAKKALNLKKSANQSYNWNTLFLGASRVADIISKKFNTAKENIYETEAGGFSAAVRLALGETEIVFEMRKFLEENGVLLDAFETIPKKRSKTVILVKNLPAETTIAELKPLFEKFGPIGRLVLPPSGVTALIEFLDPSEARKAFMKLAYSKFKNLPLYLEWAPENTFKTKTNQNENVTKQNPDEKDVNEISEKKKKKNMKKSAENVELTNVKSATEENIKQEKSTVEEVKNKEQDDKHDTTTDVDNDEPPEPETTIFLRNLNFKTRENAIREHFKHLGPIHIIQVAMKKDSQDPKQIIPLGYGFIQFKKRQSAQKALKDMQFTNIEGNKVELKRSDRVLKDQAVRRKTPNITAQTGTKILVKNIPFQAKPKEIEDLFKTFGELRSVRLPKKMAPGESTHRGFGFVDYFTKADAKRAFETLCQSTHLYDRRLVLEWAAVDNVDVSELRKRTAEHFTGNTQNKSKKSRKAVFDTSNIDTIQDDDVDELKN